MRFLARKYGLTDLEARRLYDHPDHDAIIDRVETWRENNGLPAANSPLARGFLLDVLEGKE